MRRLEQVEQNAKSRSRIVATAGPDLQWAVRRIRRLEEALTAAKTNGPHSEVEVQFGHESGPRRIRCPAESGGPCRCGGPVRNAAIDAALAEDSLMSDQPSGPYWTAAKPNRRNSRRVQTSVSLDAYLAGGLHELRARTGVPMSRLCDDAVSLLMQHYWPVLTTGDRAAALRAMQRLRVTHSKPPEPELPIADDEPEGED